MKISLVIALFFIISLKTHAQNTSTFNDKIRFGGSAGLDFGTGYFSAVIAPSAIYQFNPVFATGVGLNYSYIKLNRLYSTNIYGASLIGLANPIQQLQLSAELEQSLVNTTFVLPVIKDQFWITALYVGAGYVSNGVTIGVRYNVLFNPDKSIYNSALMPFVRVYF